MSALLTVGLFWPVQSSADVLASELQYRLITLLRQARDLLVAPVVFLSLCPVVVVVVNDIPFVSL